jgi:hypothetical protein
LTNRWSDVGKGKKEDASPFQIHLEGTYVCQHCAQYVDGAEYLPDQKVLTWKCTNGHKSWIEGFSIG